MFFFLLFIQSSSLSIKSLLEGIFNKTPIVKKLLKFLGASVFALIAYYLYTEKVKVIGNYPRELWLAAATIAACVLIPKPNFIKNNLIFKIIKNISYLILILAIAIIFGLSQYNKLALGTPFLRVKMTGENIKKTISYLKNYEEAQKVVTEYKVVLENLEGTPLCEQYVYGDLIGIRVKTLQFSPFLNWIGFDNCYKIDMIYNGFIDKSSYSLLPIQTIDLNENNLKDSLLDRLFHRYWSQNYYSPSHTPLIKSAALQSQYFPLVNPDKKPFVGSFELVLYSTGIGGKVLLN